MSIWNSVDRAAFTEKLTRLKNRTEHPGSFREYTKDDWLPRVNPAGEHRINFERERVLADGLAFVVCNVEGPLNVTAVALEQHVDPPSLTIRAAANEGVPDDVTAALIDITTALQQYARKGTSQAPLERSTR